MSSNFWFFLSIVCLPFALFADAFIKDQSPRTLATVVSEGSFTHAEVFPKAGARDYGLLFWQDGVRGVDADGNRILCLLTGYFGAAFNITTGHLERLGMLDNGLGYSEAVASFNKQTDTLPLASSNLLITVDGIDYYCVQAAEPWVVRKTEELSKGYWVIGREAGRKLLDDHPSNKTTNVRIRGYGQYLQDFEIDRLVFASEQGERLEARVRLVVDAWPDQLRMRLEIVPDQDFASAQAQIRVDSATSVYSGNSGEPTLWSAGSLVRAALTIPFRSSALTNESKVSGVRGKGVQEIEVYDLKKEAYVEVAYDSEMDAYKVMLNNHKYSGHVTNNLDSYRIKIKNSSDQSRKYRVIFANEMGYHEASLPEEERNQGMTSGVMGALMVLRDEQGQPIGLPVQNAHNWPHLAVTLEKTPDLQPWLSLFPADYASWLRYPVVFDLPSKSEWSGHADVTHALWGGLPQASYYFLTLIGWGYYSHWDVAIQGNFGESLCYAIGGYVEADITDVRPLYVTSYDSFRKPKFEWTPNQGGGTFLNYFDTKGDKQYLVTRRHMPVPGPGLTDTSFYGHTEDGKIRFHVKANHPRTDDVNRAYYTINYEVLEDAKFSKLAFFQYGSSYYNFFNPGKVAWGNVAGLASELETELTGGDDYLRKGLLMSGEAPWWFSMHESTKSEGRGNQSQYGLASRGLIIHEWDAVLGGEQVDKPHISFKNTNHRYPGMLGEISAPNSLKELKKGDYVSMQLEMFLLPKYEAHYLGTNSALKESLVEKADSWEGVYRMAKGKDMQVSMTTGILQSEHPFEIRVDPEGAAEFEVTGGIAYVPFTFTHVPTYAGVHLERQIGEEWVRIDQSDHGNDYWQTVRDPQTDTFRVTFNVQMDAAGDQRLTRKYRFKSNPTF